MDPQTVMPCCYGIWSGKGTHTDECIHVRDIIERREAEEKARMKAVLEEVIREQTKANQNSDTKRNEDKNMSMSFATFKTQKVDESAVFDRICKEVKDGLFRQMKNNTKHHKYDVQVSCFDATQKNITLVMDTLSKEIADAGFVSVRVSFQPSHVSSIKDSKDLFHFNFIDLEAGDKELISQSADARSNKTK